MKVAAVTCARMDSERFPGKCLARLRGRPLLQYTIDFARTIGWPLYVNTYDLAIMRYVAAQCPIIFEPERFYGERQEGLGFEMMQFVNRIVDADHLVLLQPTHPIRDVCAVDSAMKQFALERGSRGASVVETGEESGSFYLYSRAYLESGDDNHPMRFPEARPIDIHTRSDLEEAERCIPA